MTTVKSKKQDSLANRATDVYHHKHSKKMQFMALGATAGVGGCQTLRQVSEQMDSLLDRQSRQRILPNESCLLAKGEKRVQGHANLASTPQWWKTAELHKHT